MKKIIVRLKGGIGNQLFSYAYAKKICKENDLELIVDHYTGFTTADEFRRSYCMDVFCITGKKIKLPFLNIKHEKIKRLYSILIKTYYLTTCIYIKDKNIELPDKINKSYYIEGYWQSKIYVESIKKTILREYNVLNNKIINDNYYYQLIKRSKNSVGVHVRIGSNTDIVSLRRLKDYYNIALIKMSQYQKYSDIYIFTDNIVCAKKIFGNSYTIIRNSDNDIVDFLLYKTCKHFIIAASTFSWWGAWLGEYKNKIIICPSPSRYKNTFWNQKNLLPSDWIKV